jgi:hypothetical protein
MSEQDQTSRAEVVTGSLVRLDDDSAPDVAPSVSAPSEPVPLGLVVGPADDRAERDADVRADAALARLARTTSEPVAPGGEHLRRRAAPPASGQVVGPEGGELTGPSADRIERLRGAGRPLDAAVRRRMESAFDTSFDNVRVHDGAEAAGLAASVSAHAFTVGRDVFFGRGTYDPQSSRTDQVVAHELAHTLQTPTSVRRSHDGAGESGDDALPVVRRLAYGDIPRIAGPMFHDAELLDLLKAHNAFIREHDKDVEKIKQVFSSGGEFTQVQMTRLTELVREAGGADLLTEDRQWTLWLKDACAGLWARKVAPNPDEFVADLCQVRAIPAELTGGVDLTHDVVDLPDGRYFESWAATHNLKSAEDYQRWVDGWIQRFARLKASLAEQPDVLKTFWQQSLAGTSTRFKATDADDHGGLPPVKMTLSDRTPNSVVQPVSIIMKSRPGVVDKMVTDLFQAINDLVPQRRPLPYYKQAVFSDGRLVSEFIDGMLGEMSGEFDGAGDSAQFKEVVQQSYPIPDDYDERLRWLQSVAKEIGLTDLHNQNVIWSSKLRTVVPIDLEAFDEGKATGLFKNEESVKPKPWQEFQEDVAQAVEKLIATFNADRPKQQSRLVMIKTSTLMEKIREKNPDSLAELITTTLLQRKYVPAPDSIRAYSELCSDRQIVPSFLLTAGVVSTAPVEGKSWNLST